MKNTIGKELKQRILNNEYEDLITKKELKSFKETGELTKDTLSKVILKDMMTLRMASSSPAQHRTIDLGIKAFKRYLDAIPMLSKRRRSEEIKEYKTRAWEDFTEVTKLRGSFPTHNA